MVAVGDRAKIGPELQKLNLGATEIRGADGAVAVGRQAGTAAGQQAGSELDGTLRLGHIEPRLDVAQALRIRAEVHLPNARPAAYSSRRAASIASSRSVDRPVQLLLVDGLRISPTRGPGRRPSSSTWRPSRIGAGGRWSTPSARARSRNQSIASQLKTPGSRPRQSDFASRASSSRSTFCASRRNAPSPDLVLRLEPHARLQVLRRHAEHLRAHVVAVDRVHVQPIEKRRCRRHALLLVIDRPDPTVEERRGRRLAEVVADRAQHDGDLLRPRQVVHARPRLIDDLQRVHPDVALGMPLGFLRAADERVQLGKQFLDDAEIQREREPDRRLRREQQLLDLAPDPLGRQIVERDRAAKSRRRRRPASSRSAPRTAPRAARAGCRRRTCAHRRRAARGRRDRGGRRTDRDTRRSADPTRSR